MRGQLSYVSSEIAHSRAEIASQLCSDITELKKPRLYLTLMGSSTFASASTRIIFVQILPVFVELATAIRRERQLRSPRRRPREVYKGGRLGAKQRHASTRNDALFNAAPDRDHREVSSCVRAAGNEPEIVTRSCASPMSNALSHAPPLGRDRPSIIWEGHTGPICVIQIGSLQLTEQKLRFLHGNTGISISIA